MRLILLAVVFYGCAAFRETPPTYSRFMDTDYTEAQADPGRVLDERVKLTKQYGPTRGGEAGSRVICGFVDWFKKIVWISREIDCPLTKTRKHERCHLDAYENGTPDNCHDGRRF